MKILEDALAEKEKALAQANDSKNDLLSKLSNLENEKSLLVADGSSKLEEITNRCKTLETELESKQINFDSEREGSLRQKDLLENQLKELQEEVLRANNHVSQLTEERDNLTKELTTLQSKILDLEKSISEVASTDSEEKGRLMQQLDQINHELNNERQNAASQRQSFETTIADLNNTISNQKTELDSTKLEVSELQTHIQQYKKDIEKATGEAEPLKRLNEELLKKVKTMKESTTEVSTLRRSVDDLHNELVGEKSRAAQATEARGVLEKTSSLLEKQLKEVEANLNDTKTMYSNEVSQLRNRLEALTNELNEERQLVTKLRQESDENQGDASSKLATSKVLPLGESNECADEVTFLREELTKSKMANSDTERALLALQEELNVTMAKVLKMENDHGELVQMVKTGEEALKAEQMRSEELQRKVITFENASSAAQ